MLKKVAKHMLRNYLKIKGIAYKSYIPLNDCNIDVIKRESKVKINIISFTEENNKETKNPLFPSPNSNRSIRPLIAKAKIYFIDARDTNFSFRDNHLIDEELNVIYEDGLKYNYLPIYAKSVEKPVHLNGTVAYLSNTGTSNYYHWVCLTLPLLKYYKEFVGLENIDYYYIGKGLTKFQIETLKILGISEEQLVQQACYADRLVFSLCNRKKFNGYAPITYNAYKFVRGNLMKNYVPKDSLSKKRIYVRRGNVKHRKVLNEEKVISLLKKYSFEILDMDNRSVQEQIQIFNEAEVIIAPHGAALTNLLFVNPGTKVVELLPDQYSHNCFYALASYGQCDYYYLNNTNGENQREAAYGKANKLDINVDINKLEDICKLIFN